MAYICIGWIHFKVSPLFAFISRTLTHLYFWYLTYTNPPILLVAHDKYSFKTLKHLLLDVFFFKVIGKILIFPGHFLFSSRFL